MTTSRSSSPRRIRPISCRARVTVSEPRSPSGCSSRRISGGRSGRKLSTRRSRVRSDMERNVHCEAPPVQQPHHVTLRPAVSRLEVLERIQKTVLWLSTYMVHHANSIRPNPEGVKVGGHQASSASVVSLLTALYFDALRSDDLVAVKAHASPAFYAAQYLRGRLSAGALRELRSFGGLQAYPSRRKNPEVVDLSTGSMGLGAVQATFGALASRYIVDHFGTRTPGRVIVMVGDAELDEGNVWEALAEEAVQGLGRVLWIVDVNRQALDRVIPDARTRQLGAMFSSCGWRVIELRWGRRLRALSKRPGGARLERRLEAMSNAEYQRLLRLAPAAVRKALVTGPGGKADATLDRLLARTGDDEVAA